MQIFRPLYQIFLSFLKKNKNELRVNADFMRLYI